MSIAHTMPFVEAGITVNFPHQSWFQFEGSELHTTLGQGFKEMDFGLVDDAAKVVYLFELKNFNHPQGPIILGKNFKDQEGKDRLEELIKKSIHGFLLLKMFPHATNAALNGPRDLLGAENYAIKIIHVVNIDVMLEPTLNALSIKFSQRISAFKQQFKVSSMAVISLNQAKRYYPTYFI